MKPWPYLAWPSGKEIAYLTLSYISRNDDRLLKLTLCKARGLETKSSNERHAPHFLTFNNFYLAIGLPI
jgi:hypothetical protein